MQIIALPGNRKISSQKSVRSNHTHRRRPLKKNAVKHFPLVGRTPLSAENVEEPLYSTLLRFKVAPNSTYCSDDSINEDGS